jgi:hypothetical protein
MPLPPAPYAICKEAVDFPRTAIRRAEADKGSKEADRGANANVKDL